MGIIEKQATQNVIISYLGAGLGAITTLLLLPHLLSTSENGLIGILISVSSLFAQFGNLGFTTVTIRFFPYFRNKDKGHHGFLFYALIVSFIGFIICYLTFLILKPYIISSNIQKSRLLVDYLFYLMPLTFFTLFFNIFDTYLRATYNSTVGAVTKEVLQRLAIIALLAAYGFGWISFPVFILGYITASCAPTLILVFYTIKQDEWHIKPVRGFVTPALRLEIIRSSLYSIFSGFTGAIVLNIDNIMVNQMLGLSETGIYRIAFFFGTIILIPARSIYRITSSIVAEAFKKDHIEEIRVLYSKSCNAQLTIGLLLFIGIWVNLDNIMLILPSEYASGRYVILYISAGYLVEMATGINQVIIGNSTYYRYDAFFVVFMLIVIIICNYLLIPLYGITGSAISTAITGIAGNTLRFILLYKKYNMQPYDSNSAKLIFIAAIAFLAGFFIPYLGNLYLDILVRSTVTGGLFLLLLLRTEASPELNQKIRKNLLLLRIK
jgi:O-antigen/teichoic acid export membrane protein